MDWDAPVSKAETRRLFRKAAYILARYGKRTAEDVFYQLEELYPATTEVELSDTDNAIDAFKKGEVLDGEYADIVQAGASYLKGVGDRDTGLDDKHLKAFIVPLYMRKGTLTFGVLTLGLESMEDPVPYA